MPLIFLSGIFQLRKRCGQQDIFGFAASKEEPPSAAFTNYSIICRRQIVKHALDSAKKRKIYNMLTDYREK